MNSKIRTLSLASMLIGASFVAPQNAIAQGKGHQIVKQQKKADKQIRKAETQETRRDARYVKRHTKENAKVARTTYSSYSRTYHVLCEDGIWARSSGYCADHGGVASRQYTPTPRASTQGILHANEHSAVARAYSSSLRTGAIAHCNDGTYWHASTRTDACYNHGGVARWY